MKTIECFFPGEEMYNIGCAFATNIYREKLHMTVHRYPDILFIAHEDGVPLACIGLNHEVHNVVFAQDAEIQIALQYIPNSHSLGEQYLWASDGYALGATILVSVFSSYASKHGTKNVIFTGTLSALRALRTIGAKPILLHPIKESILNDEDRANCAKWFLLYRGARVCILPTKQMEQINTHILHMHRNEISLGPKLEQIFYDSIQEIA